MCDLYLGSMKAYLLYFFFQAEDGIRGADVTGVQTCALPISDAAALVHTTGGDTFRTGSVHLAVARSKRSVLRRNRGHAGRDRKSTRLNSSHVRTSYAVFCLKKKKNEESSLRVTVGRAAASPA